LSFTSLEFAAFFALVFALYWFVTQRNLRLQNLLILVGSYVFYGWWDERFLILIAISSIADYLIGLRIGKAEDDKVRLRWLWLSLAINLGMLGFFKYFNFFLDNLNGVSSVLGMGLDWPTLNIILPVGISFYTLQTLSYTFDVYKRKIEPTTNYIAFFAYVSFFPQLVAGPIERATNLLPQFYRPRVFSYEGAADGVRQITWGLFMKMVVADNLGPHIDELFVNPDAFNTSTTWLLVYMMAVQIYCDFAGYSNIAIGTARILGFDLMKNFDYPFFSRNISEMWQKWHISLITWFNDYVIVWLKGRTKLKVMRNIVVIFLITGIWHGANWTYISWGLANALLFVPLIYVKRRKHRKPVAHGRIFPSWSEAFFMLWTIIQCTLIFILFRSPTLTHAAHIYGELLDFGDIGMVRIPDFRFAFVALLFVVEWFQREQDHGLDFTRRKPATWLRWVIYISVVYLTLLYGGQASDFVYFQF